MSQRHREETERLEIRRKEESEELERRFREESEELSIEIKSWTEKYQAADRERDRLIQEAKMCTCGGKGGLLEHGSVTGSRIGRRMTSRQISYSGSHALGHGHGLDSNSHSHSYANGSHSHTHGTHGSLTSPEPKDLLRRDILEPVHEPSGLQE